MAKAGTRQLGMRGALASLRDRLFQGYNMRDVRFGWLLVLPVTLWFGALIVYPLLYAFRTSFTNLHILYPDTTRYVALENYWEILSADDYFRISMRNTFIYAFIREILVIIISLGIALLLNESFRGRGIARSLLLIPWAIPSVVNGLMWKWILHPDYGALNGMLYELGLIGIDHRINFVASAPRAIGICVLAAVWKATPFTALILLAGLQTVPLELYDAAKVDGCGVWGRFRNVTLPYLRPSLLIALVLGTQGGILVFDIIYIMTGGGPGGATEMIAYFIYLQGFQALRMGYACALSYMLGIVITIIAAIYFKLLYTEELM